MSAPRVYAGIAGVTAELARTGIPKLQTNCSDAYAFRGIDDVMNRLAGPLAENRLCVLPRVLERHCSQEGNNGMVCLTRVWIKVAFDIVSARDGSCHTLEVFGEALDESDKATSKAMTAAYKQALLQAFCAPLRGTEDADAASPRPLPQPSQPDPEEGWEQWSRTFTDAIRSCDTLDALDRMQETDRLLLRAASKRCPEVFGAIGEVMRDHREALLCEPVQAEIAG